MEKRDFLFVLSPVDYKNVFIRRFDLVCSWAIFLVNPPIWTWIIVCDHGSNAFVVELGGLDSCRICDICECASKFFELVPHPVHLYLVVLVDLLLKVQLLIELPVFDFDLVAEGSHGTPHLTSGLTDCLELFVLVYAEPNGIH